MWTALKATRLFALIIALTFFATSTLPASILPVDPAPVDPSPVNPSAVDPKTISEVDAGLGPCTADFTITGDDDKPVYAAKVRVHIAYGWMNLHKFDLEVGTNSDGRARFIGLPKIPSKAFSFTPLRVIVRAPPSTIHRRLAKLSSPSFYENSLNSFEKIEPEDSRQIFSQSAF